MIDLIVWLIWLFDWLIDWLTSLSGILRLYGDVTIEVKIKGCKFHRFISFVIKCQVFLNSLNNGLCTAVFYRRQRPSFLFHENGPHYNVQVEKFFILSLPHLLEIRKLLHNATIRHLYSVGLCFVWRCDRILSILHVILRILSSREIMHRWLGHVEIDILSGQWTRILLFCVSGLPL